MLLHSTNVFDFSQSNVEHYVLNLFSEEKIFAHPSHQEISRFQVIYHHEKLILDSISELSKVPEEMLLMPDISSNFLEIKKTLYDTLNEDSNVNETSITNIETKKSSLFINSMNIWKVLSNHLNSYLPVPILFPSFLQMISSSVQMISSSLQHISSFQLIPPNQYDIDAILQRFCRAIPFAQATDLLFFFSIYKFDSEKAPSLIQKMIQTGVSMNNSPLKFDPKQPLSCLESSNIVNLFSTAQSLVQQALAHEIQYFYSIFFLENFISNQGNVPVVISFPHHYDPSPLFEQFVIQRNRIDSYECLSLSDETCDSVLKTITNCISKGGWISLHYTRPSLKTASCVANILSSLSQKLHTNFRLCIFASSFDYLSKSLLSLCYHYSFSIPPCTLR